MPTVINELVVEPRAMPPGEDVKPAGSDTPGTAAAGPELERQIRQIDDRARGRSLRLWAH
jgi:hypothetical protein